MDKTPLWQRVRPFLTVFDPTLCFFLFCVVALSCITMYSAANDFPGRFDGHVRNLFIAFVVMWATANLPPTWISRSAVPIYVVGVLLLLGVAFFGDTSKGARRWLNIGFGRIQPSEILKIAMPLMLAWYFQKREGMLNWSDFLLATILLAIPVLLIARQPDLGTAILVFAAGFFVIFLAGLSWKLIIGLGVSGIAALPLLWMVMKDYQKQRVMTLIDPTSDPLGKGFHIIQSTIAVGSGGVWGKGWMEGTQTHLEFIPERTTDFIFAVFSEEFGLVGACVLLGLYLAILARGLAIAGAAGNIFMRLLAGAITLIFFTYAFVNMGMVSGILPVVGVPLPFMSYGGTAQVTLGLGMGLLMNISRNRKLVQT
jgi:rod shape determining protein RodA